MTEDGHAVAQNFSINPSFSYEKCFTALPKWVVSWFAGDTTRTG